MAINSSVAGRRQHQLHISWRNFRLRILNRRSLPLLFTILAFIAFAPPIFFHFKLKRLRQTQLRKCSWLKSPPLVCAHGGDSTNAFPNTISAYNAALRSEVDCIEIDASRSSDGVLFAIHDRELQQITGNKSSKVGFLGSKEIKELNAVHQYDDSTSDRTIPTIEDALKLVSSSVRQVILDAKVGPPTYEKGLAKDIISNVQNANCNNCVVWAKSDTLVRDVIKLSPTSLVGYIIMLDPSTRRRSNLVRLKGARVAGVYHPLIDEALMKTLHGRNKMVYAWTVDEEESMRQLLSLEVDAIVTNKPTLLQQLMQDVRTRCLEEGYSF